MSKPTRIIRVRVNGLAGDYESNTVEMCKIYVHNLLGDSVHLDVQFMGDAPPNGEYQVLGAVSLVEEAAIRHALARAWRRHVSCWGVDIVKTLTEKQQQIFDEVKKRLQHKSWFHGVCMDNIPTDDEIDADRDDCIVQVMMDTAHWDDPNFLEEE